nr:uncharacterized protein LOC109169584 [Ipomoea trifida]
MLLCKGSILFTLLTIFLLFPLSRGEEANPEQISRFSYFHTPIISGESYSDKGAIFRERIRVLAEGPNGEPPLNSSLILASKRTYRKDPLNHFERYTGGWNISNRHYWAGKFHSSTVNTLDYVVQQANTTADNLRSVSGYLAAAKQIEVDKFLLPGNVKSDIDHILTKINSSASELADKTSENKDDIDNLIESVRLALIVLSAVMLLMAFLGFLFSIFGMQYLVYIVTGDSCVAMDQWVQNPTAHTALDDILPCVDNATSQETLKKSKEVTHQLSDVVNQVITTVSNNNFPPNAGIYYYNQSGPLLPVLCNPYNPNLSDRACNPGEVHLSNATKVWSTSVCQVSPSDICITTGRLTPKIYGQMAAAVNVSFGLYHYGQFLVDLQDCDFVRVTFNEIYKTHCPGLRRYSQWVYVGLVIMAVAVMLSLTFWVIYGRERQHRIYTKEHTPPKEGF